MAERNEIVKYVGNVMHLENIPIEKTDTAIHHLNLPYCNVWIKSLSVSYIKTSAHEEQKGRNGSLEESGENNTSYINIGMR